MDNQEKVPGKLEITNENKITLTTYRKLYDTNIICGFAEGEKITLVNVELDRTDIYSNEIYKDETEKQDGDENTELKYSTYKYTADMAIFGHVYERKGDIRLKEVSLYYTNLDKWIDWEVNMPEVSSEEDTISIKIKKFNEKKVKTEKFDLSIRNPYLIKKMQYKMKIYNQVEIVIQNMVNEYIQTVQGIVQCLQFFLILCTGINVNTKMYNFSNLLMHINVNTKMYNFSNLLMHKIVHF